MYSGIPQLIDWLFQGHPHYFVIFVGFVILVRLIPMRLFARKFRPVNPPLLVGAPQRDEVLFNPKSQQDETLSIGCIIAVASEEPALFYDCLASIYPQLELETGLDEMIVVINGGLDPDLEAICNLPEFGGHIQVFNMEEAGKRIAIALAVERCHATLLLMTDSDTEAEPHAVRLLLQPFQQDSWVGGVTTYQRILNPYESWLKVIADIMEEVRGGPGGSMRAMSATGSVLCMPGRMYMVRAEVLRDNLDTFIGRTKKSFFLNIWQRFSDDREITDLAREAGWKVLFQSIARVFTGAPTKIWKAIKQQVRWARGSQYNTLRRFWYYLRHNPFLVYAVVTETIIPFWWLGTIFNAVWKTLLQGPQFYDNVAIPLQILLVIGGVVLSALLRNLRHFREYPRHLQYLVPFVAWLSLVLTPIRVIGFFTMSKQSGWGTRESADKTINTGFNLKGTIPWILGGAMLEFFCVAGPLIETRQLFLEVVQAHLIEVIAFNPVLYAWCLLVRFVRWRFAKQIKWVLRTLARPFIWTWLLTVAVGGSIGKGVLAYIDSVDQNREGRHVKDAEEHEVHKDNTGT